jgi:hypothetical protein
MTPFEILRLNLLSPMVLAFGLGIAAALVKSDLKMPDALYTGLSTYLLFAIGLKGGFDLAQSPLGGFLLPALAAAFIGALIPVMGYLLLRRVGGFSPEDSAAIGLHYGAVSAVTLSAGIAFLGEVGVTFEGYMPTMYVIMELPAVLVGLLIASFRLDGIQQPGKLLHSAVSGKSFILLLGGVLIGSLSGELGQRQVGLFFIELFPGLLTLFLLHMGIVVGAKLGQLRSVGPVLLGYALLMPAAHGVLGVWLGGLAGLSVGGAFLLGVLAASASFITGPAVVQANIPDANPGYYLTAALVITFPFNLAVGIPLFYEAALLFATGGPLG